MVLAGIVAEYNPFHSGHAYQIKKTREAGATHVVVVMSGDVVQRGDIPVYTKFARAKAAVMGGADLVIQLPAVFSCASAGTFARGSVYLLEELGIDILSFGSEEGSLEALQKAAFACLQAETSEEMKAFLKQGKSYPRARAEAVAALFSEETAKTLDSPNNLLAIEYLKALSPAIRPLAVLRVGAPHDGKAGADSFQSAAAIRKMLLCGRQEEAFAFVPDAAAKLYMEEEKAGRGPVSSSAIERVLLFLIRNMSASDFAALPDVSEGLENRLFRAAQKACSLEEFYSSVKTKRYTLAKLRRILFYAALSISKEDISAPPAYLRVLAMNQRGAEILERAKKHTLLPIGSNFSDLYRLLPKGIEKDVRASDLYGLAMPKIFPCGMDFTEKMDMIKTEFSACR